MKRENSFMNKRSESNKKHFSNKKYSNEKCFLFGKKLSSIILANFILIILGIIFIYASSMSYLAPTPADVSYITAGSAQFNISIDMAIFQK